MTQNWFSLNYLLTGNERQQDAYHTLKRLAIFEDLADYFPILVGTIPIAIDIASSDLDILLQADNLEILAQVIRQRYNQKRNFHDRFSTKHKLPAYVANFDDESFQIEFFAQNQPTISQNGFRHMLIEARLLALIGEKAQTAIRKLKADGMKTEPAFAHYFAIEGDDPYQALLDLGELTDTELRAWLKTRNF